MLPASLAAVEFVEPVHGTDEVLAARTAATLAPGARLLVLGVARVPLLRALILRGLYVVGVDTSRTVLRATAAALGSSPRLELLAADPRELDVPGAVDAALLASSTWRAVTLRADRVTVLRQLRQATCPGGLLLLDLEDAPDRGTSGGGASGGGAAISWHRDDAPGAPVLLATADDVRVTFDAFAIEDAAGEAAEAGYTEAVCSRPGNARRSWLVARRPS